MADRSTLATVTGVGLAGVGLSHFVWPDAYLGITEAPWPENTRNHVLGDGAVETLLGIGIAVPQTRRIATAASLGYVLLLAVQIIRHR